GTGRPDARDPVRGGGRRGAKGASGTDDRIEDVHSGDGGRRDVVLRVLSPVRIDRGDHGTGVFVEVGGLRVRLHDVARLGRRGGDLPGGAGGRRLSDGPRHSHRG